MGNEYSREGDPERIPEQNTEAGPGAENVPEVPATEASPAGTASGRGQSRRKRGGLSKQYKILYALILLLLLGVIGFSGYKGPCG